MKNLWRQIIVLVLLATVISLGLSACKSTEEKQPTPQDQPTKSEHPEHPK